MAGSDGGPGEFLFGATLALVVGVGSLAGCLSEPQHPGSPLGSASVRTIEIPAPTAEGTYVYADAEEDTRLEVSVEGIAPRSDARLDAKKALVLAWTYDSGAVGDETFAFREAVGVRSGLTLQQVAECGVRVGGPGDWTCLDGRATVLLAAQGLPGAFGAAPHWNTTVEVGKTALSVENPIWPTPQLPLDVYAPPALTSIPVKGPCLTVDPVTGSTDRVRALRFTGGLAAFTLCEGYAFPVAFETLGGTEYRLVERAASGARLDLDPEPTAWRSGDRPIPTRETPLPLTVAHPGHRSPFPVGEAHEVALNRSDAYKGVFDDGGILVGTHRSLEDWGGGAEEERRVDERRLRAVGPHGFAVDVRIGKHREAASTSPASQGSVSYEIQNVTTGTWPGPAPTPGSVADRQAEPGAGIELLEELTDRPLDRSGVGLWATVDEAPWGHRPAGPSLRGNGSSLVAWFQPPETGAQPVPWQGVVDGPTSTVLWFDVDRGRLPFAGVEGR